MLVNTCYSFAFAHLFPLQLANLVITTPILDSVRVPFLSMEVRVYASLCCLSMRATGVMLIYFHFLACKRKFKKYCGKKFSIWYKRIVWKAIQCGQGAEKSCLCQPALPRIGGLISYRQFLLFLFRSSFNKSGFWDRGCSVLWFYGRGGCSVDKNYGGVNQGTWESCGISRSASVVFKRSLSVSAERI